VLNPAASNDLNVALLEQGGEVGLELLINLGVIPELV